MEAGTKVEPELGYRTRALFFIPGTSGTMCFVEIELEGAGSHDTGDGVASLSSESSEGSAEAGRFLECRTSSSSVVS